MLDKRIVVIGGGLGGLAGAISLARSGFHVELFEKNLALGGKMNELTLDGYRFDTGPSLLTMPFIIDELFEFAGFQRSDFLTFEAVAPICRYYFADGSRFDAHADASPMNAELDRFAPDQKDAFQRFLVYSKRIYDLTADAFIFNPIHEPLKLLNFTNLKTLVQFRQIDAFRTVHDAVSRYFSDPRMVQVFDRYPTYNGSDPFKAPATLNIIPHVEYNLGGFYIKGGMYRLVEALHQIAVALGVKIETESPVSKIEHRKGHVIGVRVYGEFVPADAVLCNADVVESFNGLIDGHEAYRAKLNALEPSISGMVFLWGVEGRHDALAHHNIMFSENYRREFQQIFDELTPPDDPTVYIAITSKSDPDHAPANGENWFVLLNMPYLAPGQEWDKTVNSMRAKILQKLSKLGIHLDGKIRVEKVLTPVDFQNWFGSNRGSIYGISSNNRNMAFLRPPNRSRRLKGLFFAGGSTHPGGGVPLVIQSGKIAAQLICEQLLTQ